MKKIILLFSIVIASYASAQSFYKLEFDTASHFGFSNVPVVKIALQEVSKPDAMEIWQKYFKKFSKENAFIDESNIHYMRVVLPHITSEPLDIYSQFRSIREGVEVITCFRDSTMHIALDSHRYGYPIEMEVAKYLKQAYTTHLNQVIKFKNGQYSDLEKEAKKQQKEIDKLSKKVIELETDNENLNKEIEINGTAYEELLGEINVQKSVLAKTPKNDETYKVVEKELSNMEKHKDGLDKEIKKLKAKVFDNERLIEDTNAQKVLLQENLEITRKKMTGKRNEVLALEEHLYGIQESK